jgi:hypothetical protein
MANAIVSPPAEFGNWLANTIKNPNTAINDSANFGAHVGKTIADDVKAVRAADAYVQTVKEAQAHGNYSKPLVDIGNELHRVAEKFGKLNPAEQTKLVTEQVVSLELQVATGKVLTSAPTAFASLLEKMDEFKVKSDAHRLHFGVEHSSGNQVKELVTKAYAATHSDHLAGAKNSRFKYEEYEKVRLPEIPIQCHKNACVAAVGEILSEGKIEQRSLVRSLELHLNEEQRGKESSLSLQHLAKELGPEWQQMTISKRLQIDEHKLLDMLLSTKRPFAVTLKNFESEAHAVVVDGISNVGRFIIRDPGDGTMYQMTKKDFMDHWTYYAVAKRNSHS